MPTIPESPRASFLAWCEAHGVRFVEKAASIGLSEEHALAFQAATGDLAAKLAASESAKFLYRAAVADAEASEAALRRVAGSTLQLVRAFARASADPAAVYALAQVPPPSPLSVAPPPGTPRDLAATIHSADGTLELTWTCRNPRGTRGTTYIIRRRHRNEDPWTVVDVTGAKRWTDTTLVGMRVGVGVGVQYSIIARRASGGWHHAMTTRSSCHHPGVFDGW